MAYESALGLSGTLSFGRLGELLVCFADELGSLLDYRQKNGFELISLFGTKQGRHTRLERHCDKVVSLLATSDGASVQSVEDRLELFLQDCCAQLSVSGPKTGGPLEGTFCSRSISVPSE
jgi:hypothetical protein